MNKIFLENNIFYVEDFLSQDEIDTFKIDCLIEDSWGGEGETSDFWMYKIKYPSSQNTKKVLQDVNDRVSLIVDDKDNTVVHTKVIQRILPGLSKIALIEHHDSKGDFDTDSHITKGIVIYINDDYVGGEIEYTKKNIVFKPKAGMMIVHPGTEEYSHRVLQVKENPRYFISVFAYDNDVKWGQSEESEQYTYLNHIV
jgi:hypothetical protein